jgi:protein ImuA
MAARTLPSAADSESLGPSTTLPRLPANVEAAVWRGTELGQQTHAVVSSGWEILDGQLPGSGWPCQSVTEILTPQPSVVEWRLLAPALRRIVANGGQVVVVGPPRHPYLPGLLHEGLNERQLVWVQTDGPAERLWVTEQLIKANASGALIAWLPQARQEQLRRLQVCVQGCEGLVFLCRPEAAQHEASAAPLRVHATFGLDWELHLRILKRRGPAADGTLALPSVPGGLASVITPRLLKPSRLFSREVPADVVGSTVVPLRLRRHAAAH